MSMPTPVLPPPLREGDHLTREEFLRRWDAMPDLKFAELIDGIVHMPSPLSNVHGDFQARVCIWLGYYDTVTSGCSPVASVTWLMSDVSVPQPDLALKILAEYGGQSWMEGEYPGGAPELIVEISHTTEGRDSGVKRRLYERSGVQEYLIVKSKKQQIAWQELVEGKYREMPPGADGLLRSRVFPGLWLNTEALWNCDYAALPAAVQQGTSTPEHAEFIRKLANGAEMNLRAD
jgi:Uma2 family endonuclease